MRGGEGQSYARTRTRIISWLVHALTASGAVLAVLALLAVEAGHPRAALLWLLLALAVDGIDGPLARRFAVSSRLPHIDGATLDLVVDYLTFVFVPTLLLIDARLLSSALAIPLAAVIQFSALYHYARIDLKTPDNYFQGFPALWNLVAFYLFVGRPGPIAGMIVVLTFSLLTVAPVCFVHPVRVRRYRPISVGLSIVWGLASAALLLSSGLDPIVWGGLLGCSLGAVGGLFLLGLLRTVRGPDTRHQDSVAA